MSRISKAITEPRMAVGEGMDINILTVCSRAERRETGLITKKVRDDTQTREQ
jgi:hypothetical protein